MTLLSQQSNGTFGFESKPVFSQKILNFENSWLSKLLMSYSSY